jgi:acyl transferase domain-containing protein/thioesterase domain-containing protein/acyl carrier protein
MTTFDDNDIAIVGLALRVPGASTPEEYWSNLVSGHESLQTYSEEELLARGVSPAALADPNYIRAGMTLQNMDEFDPEFFGFSPKEAAILDPQHRQLYEVAWEALERAGHPPSKFDGSIGVFAGCGMGAYFAYNILTNRELLDSVGLFLLRHTGNDKDFLSTRISYSFDLKGPSVNVQTACSTSLVATHLAVQSLLSRECDMALAGGVTIEQPHSVGYHYQEGEILSPDGHCRTFDHRAKGTIFGSGAGMIVLRRLADAIADGDHIHAIIKGSAVNNDGSSKVGYLAPSVDGQAAAISEAIAISGVEADSIGYIECHGTATPVGDPIEIAALTQAFRESTDKTQFCYVGSVKTNIGHLDTAAGVASLIKTSLSLENGRIPPSLNYEAPNPTIAFSESPFKVADRLIEWPTRSTPRRAAVNSLGVGGTNAFVVLQEPPYPETVAESPTAQPIVLSARNRRALDDAGQQLAKWLRENPSVPLADVAWTLWEGRHGFEQRRVLGASSHEEAAQLLESGDARRVFTHAKELDRPSIVFMYPGGGAQYFQMGRGLYLNERVFRENMDRGFSLLKSRHKVDLAPVFLAEEAAKEATNTELAKPSVQLPLIFLVEYALTKLWEHYGIKPAALMGHSMGENTAACIAGVISFEDALGLVLLRGQLMDEVPEGAMLSVSMPARELATLLGNELDLATSNSPQLSVASGPAHLIDALAERLTRDGIDSQRVRINIAAHSRMLEGILERFRAYLKSITLNEPTLPIVSNRTGKWLPPARARDPEYWVEHLRNTVLFADNIETLLESNDRVFLEVGPGNTLGSFVRQNPAAPAQRVLASLRHPNDPVSDNVFLRAVAARLWAVGAPVSTSALWQKQRRRVPMPTYPFQHSSYWIAPGVGLTRPSGVDDRPMRLAELETWFRTPRWVQQGILEFEERPSVWLVFQSREPLAELAVQQLRGRGEKVISVLSGDTFARIDDQTFTLAPEAGGAGYAELIADLADRDLLPDRVLHTWLVTWEQTFRPGSTFFHRNQEYGFYSLFHLAQALGKAGVLEKPIQFIVAGNGLLRVSDEPTPYPDKATVLGPCAVIPREFPNIQCRFIDIALPEEDRARRKGGAPRNPGIALDSLLAELSAASGNGVFCWRNGVRWQRHVLKWASPTESATTSNRLKTRGVYLITGGLGGIAGVLAEWLAKEYQARLVLLARTPLPKREDWDDWLERNDKNDSISASIQRIRQLELLGGKVLPIAADVTVAERMGEVVAEVRKVFGEINGVFHAAGVVRDSLIQLKSQRDIEEVFSAKVYGTVVLDQLFEKSALDFMVLFSSTSSYIAPQGQVDYVGANSFLNAFADARRGARSYPVIAVNWGVWKGVGMVSGGSSDALAIESPRGDFTRDDTHHPLLERHISSRDGLATVHWFEGKLSAERDWVVDEHRLGNGDALLPGTGYLELLRAALFEIGVTENWQVSNLLFQAPLYVRDGNPRAFRLRLRGDEARWEVDIFAQAMDAQGGQNQWQQCASARVLPGKAGDTRDIALQEIEARCTRDMHVAGGTSALRTRQEDHLRFGPRWRVLRRQALGDAEALARLRLADEHANDLQSFGLHPGLLDIATGYAMDLIPGYAEQEITQNLWAPIMYRSFRMHAPLTQEIESWVRLAPDVDPATGYVAFNVVITDPAGRVLVEVDHLTLRRIDGLLSAPQQTGKPVTLEGSPAPNKGKPLSPVELALQHNVSQGIDAASGVKALSRVLGTAAVPSTVVVSSMDLPALIRQIDTISKASTSSNDARFTRPQLDSDFEAPRDDVERQLSEIWGKLLGVEGVGIRDSFFDLGGHSLIAVRLFNEIADKFGVDLPMSVLMQSPTIAALADLLKAESPNLATSSVEVAGSDRTTPNRSTGLKYLHLVPMHSGPVANRNPLFVVAGMFGNVLNLGHLAHLLGEERPFYALQARGLFGDMAPHETFEEAAKDYIAEIRQVQPHGPYLLGGFSGGGIIAYEIARQLLAAGESVSKIILLDTPIRISRHFSLADRLSMFVTSLRREGPSLLLRKFRQRIEWEKEQRDKHRENRKDEPGNPTDFQSNRIGDAFLRALERYEFKPAPVDIALFRPRLKVHFVLSGGRMVDGQRNYIHADNDWTRFVRNIEIHEVPGDHDGMVLEPNVRVLVGLLRRSISGL